MLGNEKRDSLRSSLKRQHRSWIDPLEPRIQDTFYHKNIQTLRPNYVQLLRPQQQYSDDLKNLFNNDNANISPTVESNDEIDLEMEENVSNEKQKFGTLSGVLFRCLLNIFGVILFLRMGFIVAQSGIILTIITILCCTLVTFITTLSMSALVTNGKVESGGVYFMVSRSLGAPIGGTIGLLFGVGNAIATSMYLIGFAEILVEIIGISITNCKINDIRCWSNISLIIEIIIASLGGMKLVMKLQKLLLFIIITVILLIFIGGIYRVDTNNGIVGWHGLSSGNFKNNLFQQYTIVEGIEYDFFKILAIFFPGCTGFLAGANVSSILKNPSISIPRGTLSSILITSTTYILLTLLLGIVIYRDALLNNTLIFQFLSVSPLLFLIGVFVSSLAAAMASLTSAPEILQAVVDDGIISVCCNKKNDDNTYKKMIIVSFVIAFCCNLLGELNMVAPLITNIYLLAYGTINFACFCSSISKSPGWRPMFIYFNKYIALIGSIMCVTFMTLNNWLFCIGAFLLAGVLFLYIKIIDPDVDWGKIQESREYYQAFQSVLKLDKSSKKKNIFHTKHWRPGFLVLSGEPINRGHLIQFASTLSKSYSPTFFGCIKTHVKCCYTENILKFHTKNHNHYLPRHLLNSNVKGFFESVIAKNMREGIHILLQTCGLGALRPNTLIIGYRHNWQHTNEIEKSQQYIDIIRDILQMGFGLLIVRNFSYIDWKSKNYFDSANTYTINPHHENEENFVKNVMMSVFSPKPNRLTRLESNFIGESITSSNENKKFIDVYWLVDDGGLTVLFPYILSQHSFWKGCILRLNIISKADTITDEYLNVYNLMKKFRLPFAQQENINIIEIDKEEEEPTKETLNKFTQLIQHKIDFNDLIRQEIVMKWLKVSEIVHKHSQGTGMIIITLPLPTKLYESKNNTIQHNKKMNTMIYFAILELLTQNMPPSILIRGNGENALTFYSE